MGRATCIIRPETADVPEALAQTVRDARRVGVLTGAGVSAESGIPTFRGVRIGPPGPPGSEGSGGQAPFDPMVQASPEGFAADPERVWQWYEWRRRLVRQARPNAAHLALARLEQHVPRFTLATQNVDDLHERAGSAKVLHLHGELKKSRSTADPSLIYDIEGTELDWGDKCELGSQLRPHVVWFGEPVPAMAEAAEIAQSADIFAVVGSSLVVYPAAALVQFVPSDAPVFLVDPKEVALSSLREVTHIMEKATTGVPKMLESMKKLG